MEVQFRFCEVVEDEVVAEAGEYVGRIRIFLVFFLVFDVLLDSVLCFFKLEL